MRNKFLLILLVITLGMMGTSKARTVDDTPYIKADEMYETGLNCAGEGNEKLELTELDGKAMKLVDTSKLKGVLNGAEPTSNDSDITYSLNDSRGAVKMPFYFKAGSNTTGELQVNYDRIDNSSGIEKVERENVTVDINLKDYAEVLGYVKYADTEFYLLKEQVDGFLDNDKKIFAIDGDKISVVDLSEGELYTEEKKKASGDLTFTQGPYVLKEIKVEEITETKNISKADNGFGVFYVCEDEAKPNGELVASNGASLGESAGTWNDELKLSKFELEKTCGFFWQVNNGGNGITSTEGLDCEEQADGNGLCAKHRCGACSEPIIGVNKADGAGNVSVYQGNAEGSYSEYCVEHFCLHLDCKNRRKSESTASSGSNAGEKVNMPGYCKIHNGTCTIKNCNNPVSQVRQVNGKNVYVCEEHWGIDSDGDGVGDVYQKLVADALAEEAGLTGEGEGDSGSSDGGSSYYDGGGSYSYDSGSSTTTATTTDSTTCTHASYPVPNTVTFTDVTATNHVQVWTCTNCKTEQKETYDHTYIEGKCVCGKEEDKVAPTVELVGLEADSNNSVTASVGTTLTLKLTDNEELKTLKYMLLGTGSAPTPIEKELTGTEQQIQIETPLTQNGTYYLYVTELKDAQGNNTSVTYTIVVKESERPTFKVENALSQSEAANGMTYLKMEEGASKLVFTFADNEALKSFTYSYNGATKTETLSGKEEKIEVDIDMDMCFIFNIVKLEDASGNAIENVSLELR